MDSSGITPCSFELTSSSWLRFFGSQFATVSVQCGFFSNGRTAFCSFFPLFWFSPLFFRDTRRCPSPSFAFLGSVRPKVWPEIAGVHLKSGLGFPSAPVLQLGAFFSSLNLTRHSSSRRCNVLVPEQDILSRYLVPSFHSPKRQVV